MQTPGRELSQAWGWMRPMDQTGWACTAPLPPIGPSGDLIPRYIRSPSLMEYGGSTDHQVDTLALGRSEGGAAMELKQLNPLFTRGGVPQLHKAAEKSISPNPHQHAYPQLEEELHSRLIIGPQRASRSRPGGELLEGGLPQFCACGTIAPALGGRERKIIRLGASTIPSPTSCRNCSRNWEGHPDTIFPSSSDSPGMWTDCCRAILTWVWWDAAARTRPGLHPLL